MSEAVKATMFARGYELGADLARALGIDPKAVSVSGVDIHCHVQSIVKAVVYVNVTKDQADAILGIAAKNKGRIEIEQIITKGKEN